MCKAPILGLCLAAVVLALGPPAARSHETKAPAPTTEAEVAALPPAASPFPADIGGTVMGDIGN